MNLPWMETIVIHDAWIKGFIGFMVLLPLMIISNMVAKHIVLRLIRRTIEIIRGVDNQEEINLPVASRLANIVPLLIIFIATCIFTDLPDTFLLVIQNICSALIIFTVLRALSHALEYGAHIYTKDVYTRNAIKGYIQVAQILVNITAILLVISFLLDQNPLVLFSGLGAMTAVLLLIFKDTILSFVASVQINSSGLVCLDDWIEIPSLGVTGRVKDVALHTITVENRDKTLTVLPLQTLTTQSFKNWRNTLESGKRKIKRTILVDQTSIRFLSDAEIQEIPYTVVMSNYFESIKARYDNYFDVFNQQLQEHRRNPVAVKSLTNVGLFREYVKFYLNNHDKILGTNRSGVDTSTFIESPVVRLMQSTPLGLPIEINCFVSDSSWINFEEIQSEIFEHISAMLPEFGLKIFQSPSPGTPAPVSSLVTAAIVK